MSMKKNRQILYMYIFYMNGLETCFFDETCIQIEIKAVYLQRVIELAMAGHKNAPRHNIDVNSPFFD